MRFMVCILVTTLLCVSFFVASANDFTLGIFGNANMDDTIDEMDIEYVRGILDGTNEETKLADANYDGVIDDLDIVLIEQIISDEVDEITVLQYLGTPPNVLEKPVTVTMPITKVVATNQYAAEAILALGEKDKLVGVTQYAKERELRELISDIPSVGGDELDMEEIVKLDPDVVIDGAWKDCDYEDTLTSAGISLIQADYNHINKYANEVSVLGWLLGSRDESRELIDFEQENIDFIRDRVKDIPPEQKVRVYFEWGLVDEYNTVGIGNSLRDSVVDCGGMNIFDDVNQSTFTVDPEIVVTRNPQVIFKSVIDRLCSSGYGITDTSDMEAWANAILSRPELASCDAVKDERVYLLNMYAGSVHPSVYRSYVAKCLYPDKFQDMDPESIHELWIKTFLGSVFEGTYAYPLPK